MIVMRIEADNLFSFENFSLSFTYPKKIVNSKIVGEHLEGNPRFRYKKLITLMGANASGKTSIGKLFVAIFNFISRKEVIKISQHIKDKNKKAKFLIDFVLDGKNLYTELLVKWKMKRL